jgi:hypothetical protein
LVLIGTEEQNTVVARLAPQLPVHWTKGKLSCSDGVELGGTNRLISLLHYNPLAPQHLLFWVAADTAQAYTGGGNIAQRGADFVALDLAQAAVEVARSFDSRWRWDPTRAKSPLLPSNLIGNNALGIAVAKALWKGSGADFLFTFISTNTTPVAVSGTTRWADGLAFAYYQPLGFVDLSGAELLEAEHRRKAEAKSEYQTPLYPAFDAAKIHPDRRYRVAVSQDELYLMAQTFKLTTSSLQITDLDPIDILIRSLPLEE